MKKENDVEEKQDLQKAPLDSNVIHQGFSNQLKELTLLNKHSPRIFIVYAHSLDGQEEAEESAAFIAKQMQGYLQPTILAPCPSRDKHLDLNIYSVFSPQGNGSDSLDEYKKTDVLYRQLCLLPKHTHSVDYVVVYGSHSLQEYCEIKEVKEYTYSLRRMLSAELSKPEPDFQELYTKVESALYVLKSKCSTEKQQFHSLYTELALLTLRQEERYKESLLSNDVITLLIDRNPVIRCSSMLQDNGIYMGTVTGLKKDPKVFYLGIFQLLSRLFGKPELGACRAAIVKAHSEFITNIDSALWRAEDARELAKRLNAHEEGKIARQRTRAKNSFFALSASSEEELITEACPKPVVKAATTVIDAVEITEVLRAMYQQDYYAKLLRLFSEETAAIADAFVNVAILKEEVVKEKESKLDTMQEKEDKQKGTKEIQDNRLESHERLYEVHETISIGALFAPLSDTCSPKKLLLYGRAGIGKTVLCQYVANQWARKSEHVACFSQFQAVFWIPLRELLDRLEDRRKHSRFIQREMLVAEMVTACCLRDSDWQEKTKKQQLQLWLKANAERTLFILDGYDEIAETAATPCMLSDCLGAVLNETQYKPYVMLTSRPITIGRQYGSFDRRLECMGFIDENIPVFVSRYISELQQSNDCLTFLKAHPSIWGTAHIPIHLELICWLWSRGELSLRSEQCLTMAALYTEIVEKIGRANYKKHALLKETCLYTCYGKESPTKHPIADFANDFLSFLSFHAMKQEGVLLPGRKIKAWAQEFIRKSKALQADKTKFDAERLLAACLHLGLLKSTSQGGKDLFDHTYYFIHLSFQEFFAAKYYQKAFERSDTEVIKHFRVHKYTPSYQLTWWMTAGLLYQQGSYSSLRDFFETLCTPPLDLIGIHHANLLSHCLDECEADEKVEVVAQLTQHLAWFLQNILERDWLAGTWGKTLLHCSNLVHSKSFQDAGLYLFKKYQKMRLIPFNTVALLSHLATQAAIAWLTNRVIPRGSREECVQAPVHRSDLTAEQVKSLITCVTDSRFCDWGHVRLAQALVDRSDLTAEQVQSLFACVTDTMLDVRIRRELAKALAHRSDLTAKQVQSLVAYVTDTTLDSWIRKELAQALAHRSDLTAEQVRSFFACVTDTMIDGEIRKELVEVLAHRFDLTAEQVQSLFACLTDTTLGGRVREALAEALAQRSDLTAEQVQSLFACVTDTTLGGKIRVRFAQELVQCSDLTAEQVQSLLVCVRDTKLDAEDRKGLGEALAHRSDLTAEQVQSLFACVTDTTLDGRIRKGLAEALVQRFGLTAEQMQSLLACVTDITLYYEFRIELAEALAHRSDLTAEQVQSLIVCVRDTKFDDDVRKGLAEALAQRSDLTGEQVQSLIFCIRDTKLDDKIRKGLAEALAQRSDLTAEQVQSFIACVTDTTIDGGERIELAQVLVQRLDLTAEQVQSLFACITDTTINGWSRVKLAQVFVQCLDLTAEQVQSLFACVTATLDGRLHEGPTQVLAQRFDLTAEQVRQSFIACMTYTALDNWARVGFAEVLAQCSDLTGEQVQSLITCVTNMTFDEWGRVGLAKALARRSDLAVEQVQSLIACITDTTLDGRFRVELALALVHRSDLTTEQVQSLIACVRDTTLGKWLRRWLAQVFVQRLDLTAGQIQPLIVCVADATLDDRTRKELAEVLVQRLDLTAEQMQSLFACVTDTMFDGRECVRLGQALAQRSDLIPEQMQPLLACVTDMRIEAWVRIELAKALVQRSVLTTEQVQSLFVCVTDMSIGDEVCRVLAQHSNFNVKQSQQALVYCLKNEMICEKYPVLIFSLLRTYYFTNQIEQHTVLSGLSTFLIRSSTWFALAGQQALFLYDEANGIVLLRLGIRTMEIPLHLNHNPFLTLSHEVWGGNLHSIEVEEVCRQKAEDYPPSQATTCTLL